MSQICWVWIFFRSGLVSRFCYVRVSLRACIFLPYESNYWKFSLLESSSVCFARRLFTLHRSGHCAGRNIITRWCCFFRRNCSAQLEALANVFARQVQYNKLQTNSPCASHKSALCSPLCVRPPPPREHLVGAALLATGKRSAVATGRKISNENAVKSRSMSVCAHLCAFIILTHKRYLFFTCTEHPRGARHFQCKILIARYK